MAKTMRKFAVFDSGIIFIFFTKNL